MAASPSSLGVTGAGRGIGAGIAAAFTAAFAAAFAAAGADVVLVARTHRGLDAVAEQVRAAGRRALAVPCDVRILSELLIVVERSIVEMGAVDIIVNNAGGASPRPFLDTTGAELEDGFHFNVTAAFELSKQAAPHLLNSGHGSIINITSAMDRRAGRGMLVYGTVKAALSHRRVSSSGRRPAHRWCGCGAPAASAGGLAARMRGAVLQADKRPVVQAVALGAAAGGQALPGPRWDPSEESVDAVAVAGGQDRVVAGHRQHIADASGLQLRPQRRVGAVDLVAGHPGGRHDSVQGTGDHLGSQGRLGRKPDRLGNAGRPASAGILNPASGHIQLPSIRACPASLA
jgi:NAD(P)-dependent dehydrogenase (short-subunit alcohol dehydrogenase family)